MKKIDLKDVVENLIDTFLYAGKVSLELRDKGLTKKIKSDNTPVSNGDICLLYTSPSPRDRG